MGPGMGRPSLKGHCVQCAMSNVQCAMSLTHRALCAMSLTQRALCAMYGRRFFGHGREMLACEGNRQTRDLDSWGLSRKDEGKLALRFERCDQRMKNTIRNGSTTNSWTAYTVYTTSEQNETLDLTGLVWPQQQLLCLKIVSPPTKNVTTPPPPPTKETDN